MSRIYARDAELMALARPGAAITPLSILGSSLLFADYWAADRDNIAAVNPRITTATGVSSWPEEASRNVALAQATGSKQPALSATSFGGRPGVTFDKAASQYLQCTMNPTIAASSRVYRWVLGNFTSTTTGDYPDFLSLRATVGAKMNTCEVASDVEDKFGGFHQLSDGNEDLRSKHTLTTGRFLLEIGTLSTTAAKLVVNGTAYAGTLTGTMSAHTYDLLTVGADFSGVDCSPICIHRVIIAHNTSNITQLPSADQIVQMRALLSMYL